MGRSERPDAIAAGKVEALQQGNAGTLAVGPGDGDPAIGRFPHGKPFEYLPDALEPKVDFLRMQGFEALEPVFQRG